MGDPHINTLDGADYTFNGWGEYTLSEIGNFTFQGRTTPVNESVMGSATQFSALAFGIPGAIVEVKHLGLMYTLFIQRRETGFSVSYIMSLLHA